MALIQDPSSHHLIGNYPTNYLHTLPLITDEQTFGIDFVIALPLNIDAGIISCPIWQKFILANESGGHLLGSSRGFIDHDDTDWAQTTSFVDRRYMAKCLDLDFSQNLYNRSHWSTYMNIESI